MVLQPVVTKYPWSTDFSDVIDVRSPSEFVEDHVPGAVNLPVLTDQERAEVGTLYKKVSPFIARKRGAALVSANIARHLETYLADKPKDYSPVVYCWRGGQRSLSMATVLSQIGWRTGLLQGGYKAYRTYVRQQLDELPPRFSFRVLCGLTGTAKTTILGKLRDCSAQVLDLEALAHHRGSLLGREVEGQQPSQKGFDSVILQALLALDNRRPVWVEAESNKIGEVYIPQVLWMQLKSGSCVEICAPMESRVEYLIRTYPQFSQNLPALAQKLQHLKSRYGKIQLDQWQDFIDQEKTEAIVRSLLEVHYDPAYQRSMEHLYLHHQEHRLILPDLSDQSLMQAALQLQGQQF